MDNKWLQYLSLYNQTALMYDLYPMISNKYKDNCWQRYEQIYP